VSDTALETYLDGAAPSLIALDRVIRDAHPDFDVAVKYRLLMYAIHGDWRHWVCAINATKDGVCLRFLYGVLLEDPRGVLRAGSSTLMTWDFGSGNPIDPEAVGAYVVEAVGRHADYVANAPAVTEAARATAKERRRPKGSR
jgi:hypothetical protein